MLRKDEIRNLIAIHYRHLQKLKEKQAIGGPLNTPTHILTEIEDREAEIKRLEAQLEGPARDDIQEEPFTVEPKLPDDSAPPLLAEVAYDVFISHSKSDRAWVLTDLLPRLEEAGLQVCLDFRDFDQGAQRLQEVERAVLTSRKTLVVLTPAYLSSEWNELDYTLARSLDPASRQRRLIPLLKEKCELPLSLKYLVPVDFVEPITPDFPWSQLLKALARRQGS